MLKSFWVDRKSADIDTGEYRIGRDFASEIMELLFDLTTEDKDDMVIEKGSFVRGLIKSE